MILTFPRISAPNWIAEEIRLNPDNIVIVLDDDESIHGAWDVRFRSILQEFPQIQVKHFTYGQKAVDYINGLAADEKAKVFLLTDYELLKQDLDGLDVVEKVQLAHNILVTSHYASANVRSKSLEHGTRVLPKQLAAEIPIVVNQLATKVEVARYADVIVVDDDKLFAQTLIMFAFSGKVVKHYEDPQQFLANIMHYAKDTKICLDNNFIPSNIKGMEIAKNIV
jgi:hypothetical protein